MRELQEVIEGLAEQLHRAVAVDDPSIRLLAHTAHDEKVDEHRVQSIMTLRAGDAISEYVFGLGIRIGDRAGADPAPCGPEDARPGLLPGALPRPAAGLPVADRRRRDR